VPGCPAWPWAVGGTRLVSYQLVAESKALPLRGFGFGCARWLCSREGRSG